MAVRPPDEVLAAVAVAVDAGRGVAEDLRWEQRDRYHLTLQFLGPVARLAPVVDRLAAALRERAAFPYRLGGAG
ncbi:MAG TPA: 2'-5' RNA ligase family protein, partial [Acidimicrobiia bacterium]|nr:2'-5' RNA ligase family protein [Acidimicrobiia bacterium]